MESWFVWTLALVTWLITIAMIVVVGLKSLADVVRSAGFLPKWIDDKLYARERRRIRNLLDEIGVLPRVRTYRSVTRLLDSPLEESMTTKEIRNKLDKIARNNISRSDFIIGDVSKLRVREFLNLRKAFCLSHHDKELSVMMACFIENKMDESQIFFDCIASRKGALDILGYRVAKKLEVPFMLFNDPPSIWENTGQGQKVVKKEYDIPDVESPIVIDDSCVNGTSIIQMAMSLRDQGLTVEDAFVFFIRQEASPVSKLREHQLDIHYVAEYSDDDLAAIRTGKQSSSGA